VAALLSAVVAGVVALAVARTSLLSGRESWVRDQRYAAYREVVERATDLLGQVWHGDQDDAMNDRDVVQRFTSSLAPMMLIGSGESRIAASDLAELAHLAHANPGRRDELRTRLNVLLDDLWEELVPRRLQ
jgi:hypothetical protein